MTPRQARIGVDLFTAAVVASVGVALAGLTWRLLGDPGTRYGAAPIATRARPPVDLAPIIAAAPFGAGAGAVGATAAAPQSLILRGILLASPRSASTALIQAGDAPPVAFGVGQAVGGASIAAIERDHVVLLAGAQRQILSFPQAPTGAAAPATNAPSAPASVAGGPPAVPVATATGFLQGLGAQQIGNGFRIGDGGSPLGRLAGLQPGDQIERINGQSVVDLAHDPNASARLSASGATRIDIVRGGQRLTLIVPLR